MPAPKTSFSARKVMLPAFWDVNGTVHSNFIPTDTTINSESYSGKIWKLQAHIPWVDPDIQPFSSMTLQGLIQAHKRLTPPWFRSFDNSPYSPGLGLSDFHPFPKLQEHLTGHHLLSDKVQPVIKMWFYQQDSQFYNDSTT